ncbi:hypothetical protein BDN71DRAFT_1449056 [Pleurotus eryngii]|uniref:Uncharacterized protein n=1 Tax=Pleurotus eryngii TaxID=5323 RepID=A0A9P6D7N8_PLEER|nr:hypothetical protein BDN71DRAFT_1449056 [Pleurotus eryngii]
MPMGKRKQIPTELHSELSEYSSLLRALRTSHTLDLSSQLTQRQSSPHSRSTSQEDLGELIALDDADRSQDDLRAKTDAHTLNAMTADSSFHRARSSASQSQGKKSDTWTRWPLLAGDVLVPEWGFEDEMKLFALHVLRSHYGQDATSDEDDWDEEFESSAWSSSLAHVSSLHLTRILALLATHTPIGNKSMQNRINPVGWEMVINALGAYGSDFVDETALARVKQRLEAIYGTSSSIDAAPSRVSISERTRAVLNESMNSNRMSFLDLVPQPPASAVVEATKTVERVRRETRALKKRKVDDQTASQ